MLLAIISSIEKIPLKQDIAVTGEVSIQGKVKPVGGIREKIYVAEQAGIREVLIPVDNANDIKRDTALELTPISTVEEALSRVLGNRKRKLRLKNPGNLSTNVSF
jgi:ATP-dependent Lon protease